MTLARYLPRWSRLLLVMVGLLAGSFVPTSVGAQEPASRFLGFVFPDADGLIPTRVRAVGGGGVVCGTTDVRLSSETLGFYDLSVASEAVRAGCPAEGDTVSLVLLYGSVGDGILAAPDEPVIFRAGEASVISLVPDARVEGVGWTGSPPPPGGWALMVWAGPDDVPVELATEVLGFDAAAVYRYDALARRFDSYVPGAPAFTQSFVTVQSGDVVVVARTR